VYSAFRNQFRLHLTVLRADFLQFHIMVASTVSKVVLLLSWIQIAVATELGWGMLGPFPERETPEYFAALRSDYKLRIQEDYVMYSIDILIDPCRDQVKTGGLGTLCCMNTNIAGCQSYTEIEAGNDMQIAFFQNAHITSCRGTVFDGDPNCGTYIEIHRPGDVRVIADVSIDQVTFPNGYQTTRIPTYQLCRGPYELWWVVRTRSGPFLQKRRSFLVTDPGCPAPPGQVESPESRLPPPAIP